MVCSQEHASAAGRRARPVPVAWVACGLVVLAAGGCRSHLNQQLLERELRLQEDQIYHLQDVLEEKCARLEHAVRENSSLKRQLGISGGDAATPELGRRSRGAAGREPRAVAPPALVPPTIDLSQPGPPPGGSQPTPAPPVGVPPPPTLEGVPPLPDEPMVPGAGQPRGGEPPPFKDESGPSFGPAAAAAPRRISDPTAQPIDPVPMVDGLAAATSIRRLSYEESVSGESAITHVVLNREKTSAVDGDGDGVAEALTVVFEPRDRDGRLVDAAGDVSIAVVPASATGSPPPLAAWEIPAREAVGHFRRSSRARGLHFVLRWPGPPPRDTAATLHVRLTLFDGRVFTADAPLAIP